MTTLYSFTTGPTTSRDISKIASMNDFSALYATEKRETMGPLIVNQNANPNSSEPEITQLYTKAKCIIPAVRNYLFFSSSQVAIVYFGKRVDDKGLKHGIQEGAEDFKVKMIRFLTAEMWPPLLRTDAPDESLGTDILDQHAANSPVSVMEVQSRQRAEDMQEQEWVRKSLESSMEVLVYLKRASSHTKYLKIILHNNTKRLHFDIVDFREEKFRWELRKLFTRIMDNLESQKAVDSYESYYSFFRRACEMAGDHVMELERPTQRMIEATIWSLPTETAATNNDSLCSPPMLTSRDTDSRPSEVLSPQPCMQWGGNTTFDVWRGVDNTTNTPIHNYIASAPRSPVLNSDVASGNFLRASTPLSVPMRHTIDFMTSGDRFYNWMESLEKPESATLDYKSYMSHPAEEIISRSVKFMCGFLNAYREGKLVIGVHEISRRASPGSLGPAPSKKEGRNHILLHNDLVDQFVVGVRMSEKELEMVQREVSVQLLNCLPPIPPSAMRIDLVPIKFPPNIAFSNKILILYDLHSSPYTTQDAIKQKCNSAVRFLNPLGLSVIPLELDDAFFYDVIEKEGYEPDEYPDATVEAFLIASISDPRAVENTTWEEAITKALSGSGKRCNFVIADCPEREPDAGTPNVHIVEVSIDIRRCDYPPLLQYKGKFFSGWPSIPLWDPVSERVRRYERNYFLWKDRSEYSSLTSSPTSRKESPMASTSTQYPSVEVESKGSRPPTEESREGQISQEVQVKREGRRSRLFHWYKQRQIAHRVLDFLYSRQWMEDILQFRLIHPLCNSVFENFQGTHIIKMIYRTPVGNPIIPMEWKQISGLQRSLLLSGLPPMPLLLCRVYELMGNLPSPFPYVAVPAHQQTFRLAPDLVPLYYHQSYFDGNMRIAVVLDLRDSFIKLVQLRCGMLHLDTIGGMGFDQMSNYKAIVQMSQGVPEKATGSGGRLGSTRYSFSPLPQETPGDDGCPEEPPRCILVRKERRREASMTHSWNMLFGENCHQAKREVEPGIPLLSFQFIRLHDCAQLRDGVVLDESCSTNTTSVERERPWTLLTLTNWIRSVMMDTKHIRTFGYCDRSFSFRFLRVENICAAHFQPSVSSRLQSDGVVFSSVSDCLLHRRQQKWLDLS